MSYDIYLNDPITGEVYEYDTPHHLKGGTYHVDGTRAAWLNVTYNYSEHYYWTIDEEKGIRKIYGMTGAESIPLLENAVSLLKDDCTNNYFDATEGNAKRALQNLIALAKMAPDCVWDGD